KPTRTLQVAEDAQQAEALQAVGDLLRVRGDLPAAIRAYGAAIRVGPSNTALYYLRGSTRLQLGDNAGAIEDFDAGLKLDPQNATLQGLRAQAQVAKADPKKPVPAPAHAVDGAEAAVLQKSADAAKASGDLQAAIRDYSRAIE